MWLLVHTPYTIRNLADPFINRNINLKKEYSLLMFKRQAPITAQLVVIKGRKIPKALNNSGLSFLTAISTNCTELAMTMIKLISLK